jgi:hypothetical protein
MRECPTLCPEGDDAEDADERVRDPHGENLHWAKRDHSNPAESDEVISR